MATAKTPRSQSKCKFPRCGRALDSKGYCQGHYRQLAAGKELLPIQTRHRPKTEIVCERCGHAFYPRTPEHMNRCAKCRSRFTSQLSQIREKTRTAPAGKRWCQGCDRYRAKKFFPSSAARCKPCLKVHTEDQRAQKVYNLEPGMYARLYQSQGGVCYICRRATGATRSLAVDHDHSCCPGAGSCGSCVRGLLCKGCNYKILGHLRDDVEALQRAISYLESPPAFVVTGKRPTDNLTLHEGSE